MDTVKINNYIEAWLADNAGRANSMSMQIQKITDEYLEICIDGKVLQIAIPHNFYTICSSDGIISNTNCAFIGTLSTAKSDESNSIDTAPELMIALNEKLDRLSSRGNYSFSIVLDSILDAFEKYKSSTECDGAASETDEEEEDGWNSDDSMALGTPRTSLDLNEGCLENGYFDQLIDDANKKCDGARSVAMSTEVPENIKDDILRWCQLYSPSDNNWCVGFEIELTGILSEYNRHRHGHVFEALGFSFATPLVIKVTFQPLGRNFQGKSLEAQGELLSGAFLELSAMHGDMEFKVSPAERKFVNSRCDGQDDLDQQLAKLIDLSKTNPLHLYGLRSLLPRIAKDFFSRGGRDPNVLLACEDNIFVRFLLFTASRLASLLKRCIVCDKELPFTVSRLCSCADELCLFGFEVLGLGAQILQELVRMPVELIDLEISLALAAANGYRDVFQPFPPFLLEEREIRQRSDVLNNNHNTNREVNPSPNKNIGALLSIIKSFPSVSEMRLCADETELKAMLAKSWLSTTKGKSVQKLGDEYNSNLRKSWLCTAKAKSVQKSGDEYFGEKVCWFPYNVLRFILCSNRLSLVFLSEDDDKLLKLDNSHSGFYQFAVVQDSPEREIMYTSRNNHEVSRFGFHGSLRENWYSILRNGLRCFSSTKLMSSGNNFGDGIYLAEDFEYSAEYAANSLSANNAGNSLVSNDPWSNGMYKDGFYVVSICEVISSPSTTKGSAGVFVVPKEQEENVAVRYLLVFGEHDRYLGADISDGHILSHGGDSVDLIQHHQNIREKYGSVSCSR